MGGIYVSCTSVTDELTELSLTRCLEPLNLEHTISNGDSVIFSWDLVTGSNQFALQIAQDSCAFTNASGELYASAQEHIITADQVPFGVQLVADRTYFFRVQARVSDNSKEPSKWAESIDTIATYAVRSNLNPIVTERTSTSLTISWDQDPEVTHLICTPRGGQAIRVDISDPSVNTATITGLTASTNYDVGLYYMSANRGELSLYTMPDLNGITTVSTLEDLQAAFTDGASAVSVSMDGSPYNIGVVNLAKSLRIYGVESAEGARPVINAEVHITATPADFSFYSEGIEWNGDGYSYGFALQRDNALAEAVISSITFKNSTITGYVSGVFYSQNDKPSDIGELTIDGCTIYDIQGSGGDGIDFRHGSVGTINVLNSTIYNGFRTFVRIDDDVTVSNGINMRNNTLMNLCGTDNSSNNQGILGIRAHKEGSVRNVSVTSNLFLNMTGTSTMTRDNSAYVPASEYTFTDNFFYNVTETFFNSVCSETTAIAGGGAVLASDPCFNSEGQIFNITNSNVLSAGAGDPRWLVEYIEPPIDNELTLIEGAKTWEIDDPTIFSGEMKVTQVKDQLRFIVSEENTILLEDGLIKFTAEGVTNPAGAVTAGGLEFHVDKPGSVLIKTADYDDITGNHVVVSLNGTVKGGAATNVNNGNVQKIIITDIAEETPIYLYASGPIAIESLAWSNDTTQVNTALPTPENVKATPAGMVQGEATDIVITWDEVENAGSYSVSFNNGASETVEGTTYTVPAAQTTFLQPGSYSVRVFANPAEGDIYNTQSSAGYASFAVLAGGGQGGGTVVSTTEELGNAIAAGVTDITLKAGTYDFSAITVSGFDGGVYTVTSDLNLVADGDVTVIGGFDLGAGAGDVTFSGISFSGNNQAIGNFINGLPGETNAGNIAVKNCDLTGYGKSVFYFTDDGNMSLGSLEVSGNNIHDNGAGQGAFDIRSGNVGNISIINNTLYNGFREVLRLDADVSGSVNVTNNTFANIPGGNSRGYARFRGAVAGGVQLNNNLFLNIPWKEGELDADQNYPFISDLAENTVTFSNNFFYQVGNNWFAGDIDEATATANGGAVLPASPVENIASGDFTLTNAVLMAKQVGDPRWNPLADIPSSSTIEVNSMEELINALASGASDITLNSGTYDFRTAGANGFSESGIYTATADLTLRGNNAIVNGGFKLGAGTNNMLITGITFDMEGDNQNFIEVVEGETNIQSLVVRNCEIKGYGKALLYNNKENTVIGNVEYSNNLVHDMGTGQGLFDIRKGTIASLTFTYNTVYKGGREMIRIDDGLGLSAVTISNNTFSEITGDDTYFIKVESYPDVNVVITSNIVLNTPWNTEENTLSDLPYPFVDSKTELVTTSNNFFYNVNENWFSDMDEATATANGGAVLTASPVTDAANGNFTVTDATVKAAMAGDPRWL